MKNSLLLTKKVEKQMIEHNEMYAYHEVGHALVGHIIGRLISEVSIVSDRKRGYKGYCSFAAYTESTNDRLQWQNGSHNPELITIMYAGPLAMKAICDSQGWEYEDWQGCNKADYDYIHQWSLEALENDEQRSRVQKASRQQAYNILDRYFWALDELAGVLLAEGCLSGGEVHSLIREALNEAAPDWRLNALGIE